MIDIADRHREVRAGIHPLPRGGTDSVTREVRGIHPLPRGGADWLTREVVTR